MGKGNFDEYEYKNSYTRIRINFLRDSAKRLNPWEITNFVSRVSTYMYKIEILNTIALAINQGVERKNIFVLDKAYKLNGNYKNFSSIDLNTRDINKVYAIGKPQSMEPNKDLIEIKYLFEILNKVNKVLYQFGNKRINKLDRLDAYKIMKQEGFLQALTFISEKAKDKIDDEDFLRASKKVDSECAKTLKIYQKYLSDMAYFEMLEVKLEKKNVEDFTEAEQEIEKNYYKNFYEYLFRLPRPVVGIYYKKKNIFVILCSDHFDSNINKNTKIDLKNITQNSPIMAEIEAGCGILALKREEKRKEEIYKLEKKKLELEIAKQEKENKLMDQETIKNELDILNKTIELKTRVGAMAETEDNLGIKSMSNSYATQQLRAIYNRVQNGYTQVLQKNKFTEQSNSIIDMKV